MVVKTLPVGIYHYHFIVDGWLVYAPDLPWSRNDSGNAYNILDLPVSFDNFVFLKNAITAAPHNSH